MDHTTLADPKKILRPILTTLGLKPKETFAILPEWWEDAVRHPSGMLELKGFLAKYFGFDLLADGQFARRKLPDACFKSRVESAEIQSARAIATAVARQVAAEARWPWAGALPSALELRRQILEHSPCIGPEALVAASWRLGIPVLYLPKLPIKSPKMDGMVTICGQRPVIVITRKSSHPSWMLFILAHELGHIANGHVQAEDGASLVDDENTFHQKNKNDSLEYEANQYATSLLEGTPTLHLLNFVTSPQNLARSAINEGSRSKIDPGYLILSTARSHRGAKGQSWAQANAALKHIPGDTAKICQAALELGIAVDNLSQDSYGFMSRLGLLT